MCCQTRLILVFLATLPLLPIGCAPSEREAISPQALDQPPGNLQVIEEHWPDGRPRLRKEALSGPNGALVNHGTYTRWFDNGNQEYEATYVHGELHGVATAWHQNGRKWTEQHYDHGVRHGARRNWDQSGRLRGEEHFVKGKPHGTWTIWKADGSVKWQGRFDHGKPE